MGFQDSGSGLLAWGILRMAFALLVLNFFYLVMYVFPCVHIDSEEAQTFAQARKNIPIHHIQTSINLYTGYKPNKTANKTTMGKNKKHSCIFLFFPFVVLLTEHQSTRERRHRKRTLTSTPFSFQLASSWRTASRSLWWLFRPASSSSRWPSSRPWAP